MLQLPPGKTDEAWAMLFLEKDRVACHPGYLFDFPQGPYLVLSLLPTPPDFQEGIDRMARRLAKEF